TEEDVLLRPVQDAVVTREPGSYRLTVRILPERRGHEERRRRDRRLGAQVVGVLRLGGPCELAYLAALDGHLERGAGWGFVRWFHRPPFCSCRALTGRERTC